MISGLGEYLRHEARDGRGQGHAAQALRCCLHLQLGRGQMRLSQSHERRVGRFAERLQGFLRNPEVEQGVLYVLLSDRQLPSKGPAHVVQHGRVDAFSRPRRSRGKIEGKTQLPPFP